MNNINPLKSLKELQEYCQSCTPNNDYEECKKNCIFFEDDECIFLKLFENYLTK